MGTCIPIIFLCFFWGGKCLQYPTPQLILTVSPADIDYFWPPNKAQVGPVASFTGLR